jgi:hypothetical protein
MTPDEQQEMARDIREIKQAVIGDKTIGLNGLVQDMAEMKSFKGSILTKVAFVAGGVSAAIVGGKAVLGKLLGP